MFLFSLNLSPFHQKKKKEKKKDQTTKKEKKKKKVHVALCWPQEPQ